MYVEVKRWHLLVILRINMFMNAETSTGVVKFSSFFKVIHNYMYGIYNYILVCYQNITRKYRLDYVFFFPVVDNLKERCACGLK